VFGQITDPDFPGAVTVGYLDGYFVFNEPNSQRFWVTSLNDGTAIDPLDFASAEGNPDNVVSLMVDHREVWLFGSNTVEVWYNAGLADFPLARIEGAFMETGCLAPYSVAKLDNSVFWLGSDARGNGIVYRNQGYNAQRVSTHAIEWQIQQYNVLNDAIGYSYQQDGHSFYVLVFPAAQATWVFDVSTGAWHERAFWDGVRFRRHRSNCQANFAGQVVVGDWEDGRIYAFDPEVYQDDESTQRWLRSWRALPTGQNNLKRTAHHMLQLDCESGTTDNYTLKKELLDIGGPFTSTTGWATNPFDASILLSAGRIQVANVSGTTRIYANYVLQTTPNVPVTVGFRFVLAPNTSSNSNGGLRIGSTLDGGQYRDVLVFAKPSDQVDSGDLQITFVPLTSQTNFTFYTDSFSLSDPATEIYILYLNAYETPYFQSDPRVMLRWSDDGGHTWSNEHWASTGKIGEYGKRVIWRRLGMTTKLRDRVYEISGTDPVKIAIMGAELSATPTSA
jgi:hypothetical protein